MHQRNLGGRAAHGRQAGAFTLIELLVVVSIIALLISILLPSLRQAREQTKSAVCLADLKGLGTASLVYSAGDQNESSMPVHKGVLDSTISPPLRRQIAFYGFGGKSGRGESQGSTFFWGTGEGKGPAHRPLNKFLYKAGFTDYIDNPGPDDINWRNDTNLNLDTYRCPSDNGYQGIHYSDWRDSGLTSYDFWGTSYTTNALWVRYGGGSPCESNSPFMRPMSRVPAPTNTVYYEENVGRWGYLFFPQGTPGQECELRDPWDVGTMRGWHGREWMMNVSFCDGHAGTIKMKGYDNPHLSAYPNSDFETWKCVIIRGQGWQIDTLPSPMVTTDIWCDDGPV